MNFDFGDIQTSSPVQETERLKEFRLERENGLLLAKRNALQQEIEALELQWNQLQSQEEDNQKEIEEDMLIMELLQSAVNDDDDEVDIVERDTVEFDESRYSTKPSRQWSLRLEYMRKFYPYLTISNVQSMLKLVYIDNKSQVLKLLSFEINHGTVFAYSVVIRLQSTQNSYHIHDLQIQRTSNNKFNTLLMLISAHFTKTKNINEFLFTVNSCYELVIKRQGSLQVISEAHRTRDGTRISVHENQITIGTVTLVWDIMFDDAKVHSLITVNQQYNELFLEMMNLYGVTKAIDMLLEKVSSSSSSSLS